jgi:hypothetical protein
MNNIEVYFLKNSFKRKIECDGKSHLIFGVPDEANYGEKMVLASSES